jgi:TolA-binding protein
VAKNKIDKETLKGPDVFISTSEHMLAWIEKHARLFVTLVLVVIVSSVSYVGYGFWRASQEESASNAIYAPENELKKAEERVREERAKQKDAPAADYAATYSQHVEKVKAQIKAHAGTKAAVVSALNLAYFLIQQNQFEQALEVLNLPTHQPGPNDVLFGFWNMHRGLALMENKKYAEASEAYQAVLKSKGLKYFHPEAMLKMGLASELQGDHQKARETYEKVGREFPNTEASTMAQQYIRLLEMNAQQG